MKRHGTELPFPVSDGEERPLPSRIPTPPRSQQQDASVQPGSKKSAISNVVRWLSDSIGASDASYMKKLRTRLKRSTMFRQVSDEGLDKLSESMDRIVFKKVCLT